MDCGPLKLDRRILPRWIGIYLEVQICQYISEHDRWQKTILKRESMGRGLTRAQQERYDAWLLRGEPRLIFSKKRQVLVSDPSQVKGDCIALQLHLSSQAEDLQVTTANDENRLVLLRGAGAEDPDIPEAHALYSEIGVLYIQIYTHISPTRGWFLSFCLILFCLIGVLYIYINISFLSLGRAALPWGSRPTRRL